jgi:hypothetical protein
MRHEGVSTRARKGEGGIRAPKNLATPDIWGEVLLRDASASGITKLATEEH